MMLTNDSSQNESRKSFSVIMLNFKTLWTVFFYSFLFDFFEILSSQISLKVH